MNCDRIASVYRWLEYFVFGRALEHCRNCHLDSIGTRQRALLLGDGDGRFLENCLRANSAVMVDSVDISEKMQCLAWPRRLGTWWVAPCPIHSVGCALVSADRGIRSDRHSLLSRLPDGK